MSQLPFSQACENNKDPILNVLRDVFADSSTVLEIGSGTGQHAAYFAAHLPHLHWLPSDRAENLAGIEAWRVHAGLPNLQPAVELDVRWDRWPVAAVDAVFSANAVHIMGWPAVEKLFAGVGRALRAGGTLVLYGPFNYQGRYTSDSNARFDQWLKARDPDSGIRDFEAVNGLAAGIGLALQADVEMPANNRTLVWQRRGAAVRGS